MVRCDVLKKEVILDEPVSQTEVEDELVT